MKKTIFTVAIMLMAINATNLHAKATGIIVSKLELSSDCNAIQTATDNQRLASVGAILSKMVLKSVIGEGVSFVSNWLEKWQESYQGADSASTVGLLFCETSDGQLGHPSEVVYTRTQLAKNTDEMDEVLMKIVAKLDAIPNKASLEQSVFTLQLQEVDYKKTLAERGKKKDLTLNYSFSFASEKGVETVIETSPAVLSGITPGDHYSSMLDNTSVLKVGQLSHVQQQAKTGTSQSSYSPVVIRLNLAETAVGNGFKLASKISTTLGASLKENKATVTDGIINIIVGDDAEKQPSN